MSKDLWKYVTEQYDPIIRPINETVLEFYNCQIRPVISGYPCVHSDDNVRFFLQQNYVFLLSNKDTVGNLLSNIYGKVLKSCC